MIYTYIIYNSKTTEPIYVGKGSGTRVLSHFAKAFNRPTTYLQRTIRKQANNGYLPKVVICPCETDYEALVREIYAIHMLGRKDRSEGPLLNNTDGGDGTVDVTRPSDYWSKWSANRKGHTVSQETRKKISNTLKGITNSDETRRRKSEAVKAIWARRKAASLENTVS